MSEADVAFRRAQAVSRRHNYRLPAEVWERDQAHRAICRFRPCWDLAHDYEAALPEGRVFVDGVVVVEEDGLWLPKSS